MANLVIFPTGLSLTGRHVFQVSCQNTDKSEKLQCPADFKRGDVGAVQARDIVTIHG